MTPAIWEQEHENMGIQALDQAQERYENALRRGEYGELTRGEVEERLRHAKAILERRSK